MINTSFTQINVARLFSLFPLLALLVIPAYSQSDKPEAFLRFEESAGTRSYYVAVYMKGRLAGSVDQIRASLRDTGKSKKLISTTVELPHGDDDSDFVFRLALSEEDLFKQRPNYRVFVDAYPSAQGPEDAELNVKLDVTAELDVRAAECTQRIAIQIDRVSGHRYSRTRFQEIESHLSLPNIAKRMSASVTKESNPPQPRHVESLSPPTPPRNVNDPAVKRSCITLIEAPPPGKYTLDINFDDAAPPELRRAVLEGDGEGPDIPNPTAEKRDLEDFLDLGLTLSSSVADQEQPDKTTKRVRTTRGVSDLFFAPILNLRKVNPLQRNGGVVQVFTPFYIDSKVSTGKITKDTLALNRIELGSTYEFRHYLNTKAYPDLMRHALSFKHNSDRDFKQDEFTFVYEFQPLFGFLNQPLGSAPNILHGEPIANEEDKFGREIVPIVGIELGRTYRVRDPKEFEGTSRNVRRFYFGGAMTFDLTKYLQLSLKDLFYVRGENPKDRTENYFISTVEAPLGRIGSLRAAHALFLSFERGEQPPFTNPSVNVFKFGYRIRARGLLIK